MLRIVFVLGWICAVGVGCKASAGSDTPEPESKPAAASAEKSSEKVAPAPAAAPAAPAAVSDRVDDPSFELSIAPAGSYAVGQLASFAIALKPRGQYHINQDYPIAVSLKAPSGLRLPKLEFKKPDAAQFGEQLARFDVPLTPESTGSQRVEANVRFAVCTPENCVPDERTLALVLAVK